MDPYLVLGVSRDCTRQEVKETFRAKVRGEHPDRGGEERNFIRLCTAYRLILSEVDRAVDSKTSARAAHQTYVDLIRNVSARSVAGKTRSRPRQSSGYGRIAQLGSGATIGGVIALMLFVAEVLAIVLTEGGPPAVPAAAIQVEDDSLRTMSRAENEAWESHQKLARTTAQPGPGRPSGPSQSEAGSLLTVPSGASLDLTPLEWNGGVGAELGRNTSSADDTRALSGLSSNPKL